MNTDEHGNKIAEKKISDKDKGKQKRILAAIKAKGKKGVKNSHCPYCGYRIRSAGHFQGEHHNN